MTQADVLVINKVDLAEAVGADLGVMERDAARMRGDGPTVRAAPGTSAQFPLARLLRIDQRRLMVGRSP